MRKFIVYMKVQVIVELPEETVPEDLQNKAMLACPELYMSREKVSIKDWEFWGHDPILVISSTDKDYF